MATEKSLVTITYDRNALENDVKINGEFTIPLPRNVFETDGISDSTEQEYRNFLKRLKG